MFGYFLLALSLSAAVILLAAGLNRTLPPVVDDAEAQTCCAYKQKGPVECVPCRPRREAN